MSKYMVNLTAINPSERQRYVAFRSADAWRFLRDGRQRRTSFCRHRFFCV